MNFEFCSRPNWHFAQITRVISVKIALHVLITDFIITSNVQTYVLGNTETLNAPEQLFSPHDYTHVET